MRVSLFFIPHRQDKNVASPDNAIVLAVAFPFLIGRIRTKHWTPKELFKLAFPFLIGRIRTEKRTSRWSNYTRFPFLIGRIRTGMKFVIIAVLAERFPFLIGRIRTNTICQRLPVVLEFPFLIGRIRTFTSYYPIDNCYFSFHSSQVG